jgi:hypothetical protein
VLGIAGRVCARDMNGVDYCADPNEVTNGVITVLPPPGAPSTPVVEPEGGARVAALAPGSLISTSIGPSGGTLGAAGVTVTIPAGALSSDLLVTIQLTGEPGPDGAVSQVFEIGPTGTTFALPVTVAFEYTDNELAGLAPSDFAVETSTPELGASWTPLTQIVVDVYAHTIAGQTTHLSPYALVSQRAGGGGTSTTQADGGPAMGGADAACTNPCTAGLTQCTSGAVQTCQTQANGCTQWVTAATCGTNQTCTVTGPAGATASCTCNSTQCAEAGTVCQNAKTLATCAKDANGCFYVAATSPCATPTSCSGMAPGAACSGTCSDSCTQGQTACSPGGLETCALGSNGCWTYAAPVACGAHQSCTGTAGAAICTCNNVPGCIAPGASCATVTSLVTCSTDAQNCVYQSASSACSNCVGGDCCTDQCTGSSCVAGGLATCVVGGDGCKAYSAAVACGVHQTCTGAAGIAACTCNTDPICDAVGTACADSMTLATCSMDARNCVYESATSQCVNGACSAGACCMNACTLGAVMCVAGAADSETCVTGTNGCTVWGPPVRDPQHCG